jgi:OmpA-OmpF porin, OOP family
MSNPYGGPNQRGTTLPHNTPPSSGGEAPVNPGPPPPRPAPVNPAPELPVRVYFDYNSHELTSLAGEQLAAIARFLTSRCNIRIVLIGHTDHVGSEGFNRNLGHLRAERVAQRLLALGVPARQIRRTISHGRSHTIATTDAGRQWDRFVLIQEASR